MGTLRLDDSRALRVQGLWRCKWTFSFGWVGLRNMAYQATHTFNALLLRDRKLEARTAGSEDM